MPTAVPALTEAPRQGTGPFGITLAAAVSLLETLGFVFQVDYDGSICGGCTYGADYVAPAIDRRPPDNALFLTRLACGRVELAFAVWLP